jgi:valyl-tRNA synthetase
MDILNDEQAKAAIVSKRWKMWYKNGSISICDWKVQRRTWYGRWKTIGSFIQRERRCVLRRC